MKASREDAATLWVCVDCYFAHHGADDDPSHAPDREPLGLIPEDTELTAGLFREQHADGCPNGTEDSWGTEDCDCERREFSWSRCDGCGSALGGAREALTAWYPSA